MGQRQTGCLSGSSASALGATALAFEVRGGILRRGLEGHGMSGQEVEIFFVFRRWGHVWGPCLDRVADGCLDMIGALLIKESISVGCGLFFYTNGIGSNACACI